MPLEMRDALLGMLELEANLRPSANYALQVSVLLAGPWRKWSRSLGLLA